MASIAMKDVAENIEISQSALYKDINILENQRLIRKNYGTLELVSPKKSSTTFSLICRKMPDRKKP